VLGGIEAGGTKFVCAVGSGPDDLHVAEFRTESPHTTMPQVLDFFRKCGKPLSAIGIGSFGPVDLRPNSPSFGHITSTPKADWQNFDLRGAVARSLNVPVMIDTDVNAALLAEKKWGAAQGRTDAVYLTVGTGIGGGAIANNQLIHGFLHSEMGHLRIPHDREVDPFPGCCPFHGDCLEGLASGPSLRARWGVDPENLADDHPAWPLQAHYLALALTNVLLVLAPERILVGGGVMQRRGLLPMVRDGVRKLVNRYVQHKVLETMDDYIQLPGLGNRSGVLGALVMASDAQQG
jgi:fructokinase